MMTTWKVHRHGRKGETGSNRITFSHVTAGAKMKDKVRRLKKFRVLKNQQGKSTRQQTRILFSREHVSVGQSFVTGQTHDIWLRLRCKTTNSFIGK